MALGLLTSFIYATVRESWILSTVLVKYMLIFVAGYTVYKHGFSLEKFDEYLAQISRPFTVSVVALGALLALLQLSVEPVFVHLGQFTAILFYAYLFWRY